MSPRCLQDLGTPASASASAGLPGNSIFTPTPAQQSSSKAGPFAPYTCTASGPDCSTDDPAPVGLLLPPLPHSQQQQQEASRYEADKAIEQVNKAALP